MEPQHVTELIPGLPDEIALRCLTRMLYGTHYVAVNVCKRWQQLLHGREFYYERKKYGLTKKVACLAQALPVLSGSGESEKNSNLKYGLSLFDPVLGIWEKIDPILKHSEGLPFFCQMASSEGKLVVMGGWHPVSWKQLRNVFVYEFTTRKWSKRVNMPSSRSMFATGACDGKIYVAGGHDENKNALKSVWMYDIELNEWSELTHMSEERDECEGVIIGSEFWVVSGYDTDNQGRFKDSAEVYDLTTGTWRIVPEAWHESRYPRSCVVVGRNGNFTSWDGLEPGVQVGTCWVDLGDRVVVTGSSHQGKSLAVLVGEKTNEGQYDKFVKVNVPDDFSGFVRYGCLVEI